MASKNNYLGGVVSFSCTVKTCLIVANNYITNTLQARKLTSKQDEGDEIKDNLTSQGKAVLQPVQRKEFTPTNLGLRQNGIEITHLYYQEGNIMTEVGEDIKFFKISHLMSVRVFSMETRHDNETT